MLRIRKWGRYSLAVLLAFSVLTACGNKEEKDAQADQDAVEDTQKDAEEESPIPVVKVDIGLKPDETVADYEGGKVTAEQFIDYLEVQAFINPGAGYAINESHPETLRMFVDSYIAEEVMVSRAPEVKDAETEAKQIVDNIKGQYLMVFGGDEQKLQKHMQDQGVTDEDLIGFAKRYKQVDAYLRKQISDEDVRKQYEELKKANAIPVIASVRHILIKAENRTDEEAKKLAEELVDRLRKGEDFAALAKEYSEDPGSKDNGGLYENANVNDWVPEFKQAAIDLPLNEISDPVKTMHGYHVMRVEKRSEQSFEEVKNGVLNSLVNQGYDRFVTEEVKPMIKNVNLPEPPAAQ